MYVRIANTYQGSGRIGDEDDVHYDANGNKIGTTYRGSGRVGNEDDVHYDSDGLELVDPF